MTWQHAWLLDDDALAQIANRGLVRRAARLLAEATPAWVVQEKSSGTVRVGDHEVRLDERGPAHARCPCPNAGVCVHVLVAALWLRTVLAEAGVAPGPAPEPEVPDPTPPPKARDPEPDSVEPERLTPAQDHLTSDVRTELAAVLESGLSHLGRDAADRVAALATDAKVAGLPLLSRHLGTITSQLEGLAERRDDVSERQAATTIAQVWALTRALQAADPQALPRLRGTPRRTYDESPDELDLVPLGASWWVTTSGARGITVTLWDTAAQEIRTASNARPSNSDPGFSRSTATLWGVPLEVVLAGPFRLRGPRTAADGSISPTARELTRPYRGFDPQLLRSIALTEWVHGIPSTSPRFGHPGGRAVLLAPALRDQMSIDEPNQQLVWPLADATGYRVTLRQPVLPHTEPRIQNLLALESGRLDVAFVLAWPSVVRGVRLLEPSAVFAQTSQGLRLIALDFDSLPKSGNPNSLLGRWELLRRRLDAARMQPAVPRSTLAVLSDDIRDLCLEVAATGRVVLSDDQKQRCSTLATRCSSLALGSLADALNALAAELTIDNLLRTQLLADRLALLDAA